MGGSGRVGVGSVSGFRPSCGEQARVTVLFDIGMSDSMFGRSCCEGQAYACSPSIVVLVGVVFIVSRSVRQWKLTWALDLYTRLVHWNWGKDAHRQTGRKISCR